MEAIADSAETTGDHVGDEPLTEEMLADAELPENVRAARAMAKAAARAESDEPVAVEEPAEDDTSTTDEPTNDQEQERQDDEARAAGADDVRVENGVKQYRQVVNGQEKWETLAEIRARAQKVEAADEYLQVASEAARRATSSEPTAEQRRTAEDQERRKAERRSHVKELLKRQALGDEAAIDELAELLDATPSAVTPDVLRALDERFDSRATFRDAVDWFETEYGGELKHQAMKSYAGELDAAIAAENPKMPPRERLKRVGDQIRRELSETYGIKRRQQSATDSGTPSDKARRKAEAARQPDAAAGKAAQEREDEGAEDTQTVIQKMAQSRHQPRAVVHGPVRNRG
jgi:hypothetical protein